MRILKASIAFVALSLVGVMGCGGPKSQPASNTESQSTSSPTDQSSQKRYHLEGRVVSIDKQQRRLIVDGKDIPGFMAAMTMPYPVADDQTLDRVKAGDQITADVVEAGKDFHLDNVVVVKSGANK